MSVQLAKRTEVTTRRDARGCPVPGRTYEVAAACGLGEETLVISLDRVDGDASFAVFSANYLLGEAVLTLATAQELHRELGVYLEKVQAEATQANREVH